MLPYNSINSKYFQEIINKIINLRNAWNIKRAFDKQTRFKIHLRGFFVKCQSLLGFKYPSHQLSIHSTNINFLSIIEFYLSLSWILSIVSINFFLSFVIPDFLCFLPLPPTLTHSVYLYISKNKSIQLYNKWQNIKSPSRETEL